MMWITLKRRCLVSQCSNSYDVYVSDAFGFNEIYDDYVAVLPNYQCIGAKHMKNGSHSLLFD